MSHPRSLLLAVLLLSLILVGPNLAQPGPVDSPERKPLDPAVSELERVLNSGQQIQGDKDRKKLAADLRKRIEALGSLRQLEEALSLFGWADPWELRAPAQQRKEVALTVRVRDEALALLAERWASKIRDALRKGDSTTCRALCARLGEWRASDESPGGMPRALLAIAPDLLAMARGDNEEVALAAVRALGRLPGDPEKIIPGLGGLLKEHKTKARRLAAAEALAESRIREQQLNDLNRPTPIEHSLKVQSAVVTQLITGFADEDEAVRRAALHGVREAVAAIGPGLPPEQAKLWQPAVALVIPAAAKRLGDSAGVALEATQLLELIARHRREAITAQQAVEADPLKEALIAVVPALAGNLKHKDAEVRMTSIYALERLGADAESAIAQVVAIIEDRDVFVRWGAVRLLGRMAPEQADKAVPALVGRLEDDSGDVRGTAAMALRRFGPKARKAIPALARIVRGKDVALRPLALDALAAIGPEADAEPVFIESLKDSDVKMRLKAIQALAQFKELSAEARTALANVLNDTEAAVRREASALLLRDTLK